MIRTLLWKEYREQRSTAVALAVLAVAAPILVQTFVELPDAASGPFGGIAFILVWLSGLVVGGQAFAGEWEAHTQSWLDCQPQTRRAIGRTKVAFSAIVVALLAAVLFALGTAAGWTSPLVEAEFLGYTLLLGFSGLGCGLLGSTIGGSTLAAIGWGLAAQLAFVGIPLAALWLGGGAPLLNHPWSIPILVLASIPVSFGTAFYRYTALDRSRLRRRNLRADSVGWRAIAWLIWRQNRVIAGVVILVGLLAAVAFPIGRSPPMWPAIGLALALIPGVGTFAPDRAGDAFRFLGDRRLPIGRVWLMKSLIGLGLASLPALLQLAAVGVMTSARWVDSGTAHDQRRFATEIWPFVRFDYLFLGPIYGYAIGQLLGMLCRKTAVAIVLSALVGVGALFAWWPSCLIGGLHLWQWMVPPLILIGTSLWMSRPWAAGRSADRPIAFRAAVACVVAMMLVAGGVAYRIVEVPDRGAPFEVAAFESSLPTPEQNQSMLRLARVLRQFQDEILRKRTPITHDSDGNAIFPWFSEASRLSGPQIEANLEVRQKLEEFAGSPLAAELHAAVTHALGNTGLSSATAFANESGFSNSAYVMASLLNARVRQLTDRGQVREALATLKGSLDLGVLLQRRGNWATFTTGAIIERLAIETLIDVARSPHATPEILVEALAGLAARERSASDLPDVLKNDYLAAVRFAKWGDRPFPQDSNEAAELWRLAASIPWELTRSIDILNARTAGFLRTAAASYPEAMNRIDRGLEGAGKYRQLFVAWTPPEEGSIAPAAAVRKMKDFELNSIWRVGSVPATDVITIEMMTRVTRRAAILQLALVIFERRHGKPAATLADLTPDLLAEIPLDPYSTQPFLYRVSMGETIKMNPGWSDDPTEVPAGQGVLWSVGGDMLDDGGRVNHAWFWGNTHFRPGRDIIFLIPRIRTPPAP